MTGRQAALACGFFADLPAGARSSFGSQPVSLTARSAKRASSDFFSFSVAGASGLPVASLTALMMSSLPMRLKKFAAVGLNHVFMSRPSSAGSMSVLAGGAQGSGGIVEVVE